MDVIALIAIGVLAGVVSGLMGVGGGIVFVPGLVIFLGLTQHHAEGTSLLAIIPAVIVGAARQRRYGNVRSRDATLLGLLSIGGAAGGVALANELSGHALRIAFGVLMILVAIRLGTRALRRPPGGESGARSAPSAAGAHAGSTGERAAE